MPKQITGGLTLLAVTLLLSSNSAAVPISCQTGPLDLTGSINLTTSGNCVVGSLQPDPVTNNANPASATAIAQAILDLAVNVVIGGYASHAIDDYSGTLTTATDADRTDVDGKGGNETITGYEYVLGKYNGRNAGFVLFYCAFDCTIRGLSDSLWTNRKSGNGYALSNWTGFNPNMKIAEPGTLALLGLGLAGLGLARRRKQG